jgi:hypothetical protein
MVGVPGRSKGCATCRKRKIGCGLQMPQCAQCIKSKRICGGYQRDRTFINHSACEGWEISPTKIVVNAPVTATLTSKAFVTNHVTSPIEDTTVTLASKRDLCSLILQDPCPLALYRQQLIGVFLTYHLVEKKRGSIETKSWFALLSQLPFPIIALDRSLLAICTARLGHIHNDEALVQKSLAMYTVGLGELQKALYDPELMYSDQTLGSCMALALYEVMECPAGTKHAYASHRSGCARLIQLRGVGAHVSGLGHHMFVFFRLQTIMSALEYHQPTYLSEEIWRTLPWRYNPKTRFDKLLDIVSKAPAIYRQADDFEILGPQEKLIGACAVIKDCWKVNNTMQRFYEESDAASSRSLYWEEPSTQSLVRNIEDLTIFPTVYHFPDIEVGKAMVFYWAALTMLWTGMMRLYLLVGALKQAGFSAPEVDELPPLGECTDFITPARNVLRSVEYMLQDKLLGLGPQSVVAPLSIVVETIKDLPQYAREVAWADEVLDEIKGRGLQILGTRDRA